MACRKVPRGRCLRLAALASFASPSSLWQCSVALLATCATRPEALRRERCDFHPFLSFLSGWGRRRGEGQRGYILNVKNHGVTLRDMESLSACNIQRCER